MDKKSMAIILAAIALSAGTSLAMEAVQVSDNMPDECASLDSNDLAELFSTGRITKFGLDFEFTSENRDALNKTFLGQDKFGTYRYGNPENGKVEFRTEAVSQITCNYTYKGGPGVSYLPYKTHTPFTIMATGEPKVIASEYANACKVFGIDPDNKMFNPSNRPQVKQEYQQCLKNAAKAENSIAVAQAEHNCKVANAKIIIWGRKMLTRG